MKDVYRMQNPAPVITVRDFKQKQNGLGIWSIT
jgi:hypothetical protein